MSRACSARCSGRHGAVGLHDIHTGAAAGEFGGHQVAGDGGARKQDAFAGQIVRGEGFEQRFGDVLLAHQVHLDVQRFDGGARGGADGADLGAQFAQIVQVVEEEAHSVGAGEDQPVVGVEFGDGAIERRGVGGRADFDGGQFDHSGAERAEMRRRARRPARGRG